MGKAIIKITIFNIIKSLEKDKSWLKYFESFQTRSVKLKKLDSSSLTASLYLGEKHNIFPQFYFAQAIIHLLYWKTIKGGLNRDYFFISLLRMAGPDLLEHCHINVLY